MALFKRAITMTKRLDFFFSLSLQMLVWNNVLVMASIIEGKIEAKFESLVFWLLKIHCFC
jgi:hypothetical protein